MVKAKSAGSFIGGIFNNPGILILGALTIGLLFFQKDIRNAFGGIAEGFGKIDIQLPEIKFPEFNFPEIKFPDFNFPEINFPDFNIDFGDPLGDITKTFDEFFENANKFFEPKVDPERMDVPFPDPERDLPPIDIVPDFGLRDDPRRTKPEPEPTVIFRDAERFARDFPEEFTPIPVLIQEESQAGFLERAAEFVKALPEVTAFTSLPDSRTDFVRRQLSRNQEDFEEILAAEARRSETIFAGLFGNVQNPNF